jgi:glycosyltransferase involved in cell wall biosynthesis
MKVLMFGWEFPPHSSGGLGTACYGLTKSLTKNNVKISFVVPHASASADFMKVMPANVKLKKVDSPLRPYISSMEYIRLKNKGCNPDMYGSSLFEEVERYAQVAKKICLEEDFDLVHCHDWMTFKCGINAKKLTKRPLIVHVHSTEFDRTGGNNINSNVYMIEKEGMAQADRIIAVSNFTKSKIVEHYGIQPEKVRIVYNAVGDAGKEVFEIRKYDKVVLFLGRITAQKGPEYYLYAAKRVLEHDPDVKFVMAGGGDLEYSIIEKAAELGISKNVLFAGFLEGYYVDMAYKMADLYVMPSVSEPFGITALEAIKNGTPVLISKQSGVSEVIRHCLKADFWDIEDMANKILAALNYQALHKTLKVHGAIEIKKFSWDEPAKRCIEIYKEALTAR